MTAKDLLEIATKLNSLIDVPADENLTDRDKKDFWLARSGTFEGSHKKTFGKRKAIRKQRTIQRDGQ